MSRLPYMTTAALHTVVEVLTHAYLRVASPAVARVIADELLDPVDFELFLRFSEGR